MLLNEIGLSEHINCQLSLNDVFFNSLRLRPVSVMGHDLFHNLFPNVARQDSLSSFVGGGEGGGISVLFETVKMAPCVAYHLSRIYFGFAWSFTLADVYIASSTQLLNRRTCFHFREEESITFVCGSGYSLSFDSPFSTLSHKIFSAVLCWKSTRSRLCLVYCNCVLWHSENM